MPYDRQAAVAYARAYWNIVTSDGFIAGTFGDQAFRRVPLGTRFVPDFTTGDEPAVLPDGTTIPLSQLDDCTHFVSCCIGRPGGTTAGGLEIPSQMGQGGPHGWVRAQSLVDGLLNRRLGRELARELHGDEIERRGLVSGPNAIQPGDVIGYYKVSHRRYSHSAVYMGDGLISCHTVCRVDHGNGWHGRFNNSWDLGKRSEYRYTFIHFP